MRGRGPDGRFGLQAQGVEPIRRPGERSAPSRTVIAVRAATSRCASLRDGDPDEATLRGLADGPADGLVDGFVGVPVAVDPEAVDAVAPAPSAAAVAC